MRDNSIETLRRQSLVGILICSGGPCLPHRSMAKAGRPHVLAPTALPQSKPEGHRPRDFGPDRKIALKARLRELRMNRAFSAEVGYHPSPWGRCPRVGMTLRIWRWQYSPGSRTRIIRREVNWPLIENGKAG